MKQSLSILLLTLFAFLSQASADVYVSPEEHRSFARDGLNRQLADVPPEEQVQFVKDLLAKIPQERLDLEMRVKQAEAGHGDGPPAYFLRKGFDSINYREEILKEWLAEHEGKAIPQAPQKESPKPNSPAPSPETSTAPSTSNQSPPPPSSGSSPLSATSAVALLLLGSGVLLGLRRALESQPKTPSA